MARNALDPAVAARLEGLALAGFVFAPCGHGAVDEIVERLVRAWLGPEQEVVANIRQHLGDRLTDEEIVAEIDWT
jgi:hypothetical protein